MALTNGPNLGLLVNGNQGEQHYTEMLRFFRGIDGLVMPSVITRSLNTPPASPTNGARYIVAPSPPSGAWNGRAGQLARYNTATNGWEFFTPKKGWCVHVDDEDAFVRHTGSGWELSLGRGAAGWSAATGTASRATFDTATITTEELAQRVKALIDDLTAQGRLTA